MIQKQPIRLQFLNNLYRPMVIQLSQLIPTEIRSTLGRIIPHHFTARHLLMLQESYQNSIRSVRMHLDKKVDNEVW